MKRTGAFLVLLAACLAFATSAQAVTLINPDGTPVGGQLQQWANESRVATGNYTLTVGGFACSEAQTTLGVAPAAPGCSTGTNVDGSSFNPTAPFSTYVNTTDYAPWAVRETLYFELGHQFDWHFLTAADRRYLARAWGLAHWHWSDSIAGLEAGAEDGLEGVFAAVYQDCADGSADGNDNGSSILLWASPAPPQANPTINDCAYINRLIHPLPHARRRGT